MRLLLDTHIILWWFQRSNKITKKLAATINNADEVYVSVASLWEIAIKYSLGKIKFNIELAELSDYIKMSGFDILLIKPEHAIATTALPFLHRDPFDRMLIAQSRCEPLTLLTTDPWIIKYQVEGA